MTSPARLRWYVALPIAALGGFALDLATPPTSWWPTMFVGVLLVMSALWQQTIGRGAVIGAVAGAAFWFPNISWLTLYLGPVPWVALSGVMVLWYALFGMGAAFATRGIANLAASASGPMTQKRWWAQIAGQALAIAGLWVLREQLQGFWPYGGFAWGRLAHTQADSPLATVVSWIGFSGLSGLLALACAVPVAFVWAPRKPSRRESAVGAAHNSGRRMLRGVISAAVVALALGALCVIPPATVEHVGSLRVGAVQGNSKSGIFDDRENGDVFHAHVDQTEQLIAQLESDGDHVDVIVWPENSAEFALPYQVYRLQSLKRLAKRADAPIVIGTILRNDDGTFTNSTLVIDADGDTGQRYDKRRPVPFAEYMPHRAFYRSLAPELVDLVQLDYAPGQGPAAVTIDGSSDTFVAALAICFDIIFDDHAEAMMAFNGSAEVIFAQTNNADFGRTAESAQQLQIAKLRAIEVGRALVNISTVGTSAIVLPDGRDVAALPTHTAASMIAEVPLLRGLTPAMRFGGAIAGAWMLIAFVGIGAGIVALFRAKHDDGRRDLERE